MFFLPLSSLSPSLTRDAYGSTKHSHAIPDNISTQLNSSQLISEKSHSFIHSFIYAACHSLSISYHTTSYHTPFLALFLSFFKKEEIEIKIKKIQLSSIPIPSPIPIPIFQHPSTSTFASVCKKYYAMLCNLMNVIWI